jgi:hypothetical protein
VKERDVIAEQVKEIATLREIQIAQIKRVAELEMLLRKNVEVAEEYQARFETLRALVGAAWLKANGPRIP